MTTMTVKTAWAFFEGQTDPELFLAWDVEEISDEEGFKEACKKVLDSSRLISGWRIIEIDVHVPEPEPSGRILYLRHRRDLGPFVLQLESCANADIEHVVKVNHRLKDYHAIEKVKVAATKGKVIHFKDRSMGKYYNFTACGIKADRNRTTTDMSLITCGRCRCSKKFKKASSDA